MHDSIILYSNIFNRDYMVLKSSFKSRHLTNGMKVIFFALLFLLTITHKPKIAGSNPRPLLKNKKLNRLDLYQSRRFSFLRYSLKKQAELSSVHQHLLHQLVLPKGKPAIGYSFISLLLSGIYS